MSIAYDPHSNSIRVPHTKEEYLRATEGSGLGLHIWASVDDDIASRISFRHEHAHFTSFLATGLSELQSVIQNWKLTILMTVLGLSITEDTLIVPIIRPRAENKMSAEMVDALKSAWDQAVALEGYFFGFGTDRTIGELFDWRIGTRFAEHFECPLVRFNELPYRRFLKQNYCTTSQQLLHRPQALLPRVKFEESVDELLSSRSVLEAFAITIEVIAEFFKSLYTSLTTMRHEPKRVPPLMYTTALREILSVLYPDRKITMEQYVNGALNSSDYWAVALIAFAAMQVPVLEDPDGELLAMGSIKQLNPAIRLAYILQNIKNNAIPSPFSTYHDRSQPEVVLKWLVKCHESIGDYWSTKFYQHIKVAVLENRALFDAEVSQHFLSWAARFNFYNAPSEFIGDGGIMAEEVPCKIRFVRTSDDVIFGPSGTPEERMAKYVDSSALHVLQAMVFGESWDSCWDRVCGFKNNGKMWAMTAAFCLHFLRMSAPGRKLPILKIADGYS